MLRGIDHDYYAGAQDRELTELLQEWDTVVASQQRLEGKGGKGKHGSREAGDSPASSAAMQPGSPTSSATSTGTTYVRHHRYMEPTLAYRQWSDPYGTAEEAKRRDHFRSQKRMLGGPFDAGGKERDGRPTRMLLGDCVRELYQVIANDWVEADPVMITTSEDLIVVYFSIEKRHHRDVLKRYMNGCLLRNPTCRLYDLRKVSEGWNVPTEDGKIMFTLRPLWVRPQRFLPK